MEGITRHTSLALDTLHVVDLGEAAEAVGGTLKWLWYQFPQATRGEMLKSLWALVLEGYQTVETTGKRLDHLSPPMFLKKPESTQFATWKGKGAETRNFIPPLLYAISRLEGVPQVPVYSEPFNFLGPSLLFMRSCPQRGIFKCCHIPPRWQ
jgi:hypothetical protein